MIYHISVFMFVSGPTNPIKAFTYLEFISTNGRKSITPFHAIWGLCSYIFFLKMIIYLQFRKNTIPRTTIVSEHLKFLKNSSQETVRVRWALGLLLPFVTTCAPGVSTWWRRWLPIRDAPKLGPNPWLHKVLPLLCPPKPRFRDQHMAFTVWYITVFQKFPHHMENLDPQETNLAFSWGIWSHNRLATNQWEIMNVTQVFITYFCLHQKYVISSTFSAVIQVLERSGLLHTTCEGVHQLLRHEPLLHQPGENVHDVTVLECLKFFGEVWLLKSQM